MLQFADGPRNIPHRFMFMALFAAVPAARAVGSAAYSSNWMTS